MPHLVDGSSAPGADLRTHARLMRESTPDDWQEATFDGLPQKRWKICRRPPPAKCCSPAGSLIEFAWWPAVHEVADKPADLPSASEMPRGGERATEFQYSV